MNDGVPDRPAGADDSIEARLVALAARLDVEVGERLVTDVMANVRGSEVVALTDRRPVLARRWSVAAAAAAVLAVVLIVPDSRDAVADWFGIGSTRIERVPGSTPTTPQPTIPGTDEPGTATPETATQETAVPIPSTIDTSTAPSFPIELDLGQPISALEARELTGLPVPTSPLLGEPSGVHVVVPPDAGQIVVVYPPSADLPSSPVAGVGALLSTVAGRLDSALFVKVAGPRTVVEELELTVATGEVVPAIWLGGEPHTIAVESPDGSVLVETLRLATNTLLWTDGGVVFRLESSLDRDQAVAVAATVVDPD